MRRPSSSRGLTLVEVLIVVVLIGLLMGTVALGPGLLGASRVRAAATLVVSGVRLGITRANTTGRPVRLVFDFETRRVLLEEATSRRFARETAAVAGGAEAQTDWEQKARAEGEPIIEGPRAPRASFQPIKELSDPEGGQPGRELGANVELIAVQTEHDEEPITSGRAYIYFWPGGVTERAVVQMKRRGDTEGLSVLISALTGRARVQRGRIDLPSARIDSDDEGFSEREEE